MEKYKDELELDKEYNKELTKFFKKELDKNCNNDNNKKIYLDEIQKHWIENKIIKDEIIDKTFKFIDNSEKDENKNLIEFIAERKIIPLNRCTLGYFTLRYSLLISTKGNRLIIEKKNLQHDISKAGI